MSLLQRLVILLGSLLLGGCATVSNASHPVTFTTFGDADTIQQRQTEVLDRFKEARKNPPAKIAEVKVLENTLPEGLEIKDGTISVKDGFPHVVLGKFTMSATFASTIWFADYDPTWRKGYCYWQVPLTWLTLGIWQGLVPLSYPCAGSKLERKVALEQMKTLAVVVGANLIVAEIKGQDNLVGSVTGLLIRTNLDALPGPKKGPAPDEKHNQARIEQVLPVRPEGARPPARGGEGPPDGEPGAPHPI